MEDEAHVILHCPLYNDVRVDLIDRCNAIFTSFINLSDTEKLATILHNPDLCIISAKTCHCILMKRRQTLYV